ncbi:hypothetical protein TKK_0007426 [Trichogramma kaykai]|uniref:Reverse transcriptase domain-containing protein n=2 Tax=Trichogramma kaykai TaxID=54128 RepID=A0ABD2WHK3_9HYME
MEDLRTAIQLIFPNYYLASIDLKDAFHSIPLHNESRKYVRFCYLGKLYQFVALPFGITSAPYIFTKIMKCVIRTLRGKGFTSVIYLDDYLAIEESFEKCQENINETIKLLESLSFIINYEKSDLVPAQQCRFLGMMIDTNKFCISLPDEKKDNILKLIKSLLHSKVCTIRDFAKVIGKLVATCPALDYANLYIKELEREKIIQLIFNDDCYNKKMQISKIVKNDLHWWVDKLENGHSRKLHDSRFQITIFTNASLSGWGATDGNKQIHGHWSESEKSRYINYLELLAIKKALVELIARRRDVRVLLRVDNTTAISYINRMGGVRIDYLGRLAREIWQWAEKKNIHLFASYISLKENITADRLSRLPRNDDTEWGLNQKYFDKIVPVFGRPNIDLFASEFNNKSESFVSWKPVAGAVAIDAFTVKWTDLNFYAFPPFGLDLKVLTKIKRERPSDIVIVPL